VAYRLTHSPLQSNSPVRPQNNRGNTESKQAEKGSWLKQVGKNSGRKSVTDKGWGGSEKSEIKKTKNDWWEGTKERKEIQKDKITYVDKPTHRVG
jgi:hypothetical protein